MTKKKAHKEQLNDAVSIVIPTIGRPSLRVLLATLATDPGPLPREIVVVDDRRSGLDDAAPQAALEDVVPTRLRDLVHVVRGRAAGPAAARNEGWHCASGEWVAFLDDDVVPTAHWLQALAADLATVPPRVAAVAGRIEVPLPTNRRPTDWERNTAALANARWATADLAYRRSVLVEVAGFDERFPRAYREDADLALRVRQAGYELRLGTRQVLHPVRPADRWISVRLQKGNADDALMRALHGWRWRHHAEVFAGRRRRHLAVTGAAVGAVALAAARRPRLAGVASLAWASGTTRFAYERIASGPRNLDEIATMVATSIAIPPMAVGHWLAGLWRWRNAKPWPDRPVAVLFDRDGTLVHDVPYNGDPDLVVPNDGARQALQVLRDRGVRIGVVSNQSGIGSGRISADDVDAVNARVDELLGPIGVFKVCPHVEGDGCGCRKPAPALISAAAAFLGADPRHCVVIGDIGSDVEAATRAGARGILVPTAQTRRQEVDASRYVAKNLQHAVEIAMGFVFTGVRR